KMAATSSPSQKFFSPSRPAAKNRTRSPKNSCSNSPRNSPPTPPSPPNTQKLSAAPSLPNLRPLLSAYAATCLKTKGEQSVSPSQFPISIFHFPFSTFLLHSSRRLPHVPTRLVQGSRYLHFRRRLWPWPLDGPRFR